jgi:hypothetical protein
MNAAKAIAGCNEWSMKNALVLYDVDRGKRKENTVKNVDRGWRLNMWIEENWRRILLKNEKRNIEVELFWKCG